MNGVWMVYISINRVSIASVIVSILLTQQVTVRTSMSLHLFLLKGSLHKLPMNRASKALKFFMLVLTCYCFNSINTTGHRLDQYEPSTPSTKGLLEKAMNRANKTWQFFMLVLTCYCAII